jgi:putative ABC transport system permease protein
MNRIIDIVTTLALPLRNVWRNRRRASTTLASIFVGTLALLFFGGYISTMDMGLRANTINKEVGHFQIARAGYFAEDAGSQAYFLDPVEIGKIEAKLSSMSSVQDYIERLNLIGMIGTAKNSTYFSAVCDQTETMNQMYPQVIDGESLSSGAPDGILIGRAMAKKLDVKKGDSVLLFVSSDSGSQEAVSATIRGIYKGLLKEQEQNIIYMPIETAWSLLLDRKIHRIICFADSMKNVDAAIAEVRDFARVSGLNLEVKRWDDLALMYKQIIGMFGGIAIAVGALIFIVIIFGISNTMYMAVSERTGEIGTVRAMGESRMSVVGTFFLEGLYLGIIGAVAAILLASVSIPIINSLGLTLPPGPGQDERIPIILTPTWQIWLGASAVSIVAASLASLAPSLKAVRHTIAEALRFV